VAAEPVKIAWDSCVVIGCLDSKPDGDKFIRPIHELAIAGRFRIVVSTLAIAETVRLDGLTPEEQRLKIRDFFDSTYVDVYEMSRKIAEKTQDLIRELGKAKMRSADVVHVATAVVSGAKHLLSDDDKMLTLNRIPAVSGTLRIMTPQSFFETVVATDLPLFKSPSPGGT